jgi:DNA-3-methyladenine glycosylase I
VFANFDPEVVAKFDEKKISTLKADEIIRQPEAKLRSVIDNAKQLLKIVEEFGSFNKYLWNFVGFKPIVNTYRIFTQIPVKSSKSETLSKDLMRRGFRYVGPTTVYSFMQAAGMVNDHLVSCYRHSECSEISQMQAKDSKGS